MVQYREIDALEFDEDFEYFEEHLTLRWRCPQCQHDCVHDLRVGWLFAADAYAAEGERDDVIIECSCGFEHLDPAAQDAKRDGCGCFFKHTPR